MKPSRIGSHSLLQCDCTGPMKQVPGTNIFGTSLPTAPLIGEICQRLRHDAPTRFKAVKFICLRDEAVVYLDGVPHVVCEPDMSASLAPAAADMHSDTLRHCIDQLEADEEDTVANVLDAARAQSGAITVVTRSQSPHPYSLRDVQIEPSSVMSTKSAFDQAAKLFDILFYRVPLSATGAVLTADFDRIMLLLTPISVVGTAVVFNCDETHHRTCTAMTLASLMFKAETYDKKRRGRTKQMGMKHDFCVRDEYACIQAIVALLDDGAERKSDVDEVLGSFGDWPHLVSSIRSLKGKINEASDPHRKTILRQMRADHLERYALLIIANAYLHARKGLSTFPSFHRWLLLQPQLILNLDILSFGDDTDTTDQRQDTCPSGSMAFETAVPRCLQVDTTSPAHVYCVAPPSCASLVQLFNSLKDGTVPDGGVLSIAVVDLRDHAAVHLCKEGQDGILSVHHKDAARVAPGAELDLQDSALLSHVLSKMVGEGGVHADERQGNQTQLINCDLRSLMTPASMVVQATRKSDCNSSCVSFTRLPLAQDTGLLELELDALVLTNQKRAAPCEANGDNTAQRWVFLVDTHGGTGPAVAMAAAALLNTCNAEQLPSAPSEAALDDIKCSGVCEVINSLATALNKETTFILKIKQLLDETLTCCYSALDCPSPSLTDSIAQLTLTAADMSQPSHSRKAAYLAGLYQLEQYCLLLCLSCYIYEGGYSTLKVKFSLWMERECEKVYQLLDKLELFGDDGLQKRSLLLDRSFQADPSLFYVRRRTRRSFYTPLDMTGAVEKPLLSPQDVRSLLMTASPYTPHANNVSTTTDNVDITSDAFLLMHGLCVTIPQAVEGCPNWRKVSSDCVHVYGTAQPTRSGIASALNLLSRVTKDRRVPALRCEPRDVVWIQIRAEVVLYGGSSSYHVPRCANTSSSLSDEEEALSRCLTEACANGGNVMVSDNPSSLEEPHSMSIKGPGLTSCQAAFHTTRMPRTLVQAGQTKAIGQGRFDYTSLPFSLCTDKRISLPELVNNVQDLLDALEHVDPLDASVVINCGNGHRSTTFATVVASLILRSKLPSLPLTVTATADSMNASEFSKVSDLVEILGGGDQSKCVCDLVIDQCSAVHSLRHRIYTEGNEGEPEKCAVAASNALTVYLLVITLAKFLENPADIKFRVWVLQNQRLCQVLSRGANTQSPKLSPQTKTSDDLAATQSRYRAARKAFNEFDADDSGSIDVDELKALLKQFLQAKDEKEFDELTHEHMARADIDNTGTLTFSEFVTLYNLLTESQSESQTAQSTTTSA